MNSLPTNQNQYPSPQQWSAPQPQPKRKKRWILPTAIGVTAGFVGVGIGATGAEPDVVTETVTETVEVVEEVEVIEEIEVIKEVEVEVETVVTEEVEVEVEVTPSACLDALDDAEAIMTNLTEAGGHYVDATTKASTLDYAGATVSLDAGTELVNDATAKLEGDYSPSSIACRLGGE